MENVALKLQFQGTRSACGMFAPCINWIKWIKLLLFQYHLGSNTAERIPLLYQTSSGPSRLLSFLKS